MITVLQLKETLKEFFLPALVDVQVVDLTTDIEFPDNFECAAIDIENLGIYLNYEGEGPA